MEGEEILDDGFRRERKNQCEKSNQEKLKNKRIEWKAVQS